MDRQSSPLVRRGHSRKAHSASVLPPCPELDPTRRRSGIRHFSHVDSIRYDPKARKVSGQLAIAKTKFRSVSAFTEPMKWRKLLNKGNKGVKGGILNCDARYMGQRDPVIKEIWPGQDQNHLPRRRPPPGQGYLMVADPSLQYPYPEHIPAAAAHVNPVSVSRNVAPSSVTPVGYLVPAPAAQHQPSIHVKDSMEKFMYIASGMAIAIGVLFTWIFRFEVIKYGGVASVMFFLWKLGQLQSQYSLRAQEERKGAGNVVAAPPQRYIIAPQAVPGGW